MFFSALNLTLSTAYGQSIVLGQLSRIDQATSKVNFYLIILMCTFLTLAVVGLVARKIFNSPIESSDEDAALNLSDLRRMHREGDLTDDEYLAARAAALAESGVYVSGRGVRGGTPESHDDQNPETISHSVELPPISPGAVPGVELGPELMDSRDEPPEPESKPDNPG